jgi:hypothetical protein
MYCIQVVTSGVPKEYVYGAGCLNHDPVFRPLYAFGSDACLYRVKLKMK